MNNIFADVVMPGSRGVHGPAPNGDSGALPIIIVISAIVVVITIVVSIIIAKTISDKNDNKHN